MFRILKSHVPSKAETLPSGGENVCDHVLPQLFCCKSQRATAAPAFGMVQRPSVLGFFQSHANRSHAGHLSVAECVFL